VTRFNKNLIDVSNCYFCNSKNLAYSNKRRAVEFYQLRRFYLCLECNGFSLYPKLEDFEIAALYSTSYIDSVNPHIESDPKGKRDRFIALFKVLHSYTSQAELNFLDYGCGSNAEVVIRASNLGINAFGVEVEAETRLMAQKASGCQIFSPRELMDSGLKFHIVFLGDVLEHLNSPQATLNEIYDVLAPGGVLVVQGPLEGATTISNSLLSINSSLKRATPSQFPPYHVSLASRKSLTALFNNANFMIRTLRVSEPLWPAPRFGSPASLHSLSAFIFSVTKLLDISISRFIRRFGTRFYLEASKLP
jgi:SAM-dependent methyltransferase